MPREARAGSLREVRAAQRLGIKGRGAAALLQLGGVPLPPVPNSWLPCQLGTAAARVLRLGASEYLLECATLPASGPWATGVDLPPASYLLLREDRCFALSGDNCEALLAEVCNVDFARLPSPHSVILTLMAGVAVTVIRDEAREPGARGYRIWCDPSFADYLASVLATVVRDSGGSVLTETPHDNEVSA